MRLTPTRRVIIALVGVAVVALLLFPPTRLRGWATNSPPPELAGHMWIADALDYGIDVTLLVIEILLLLCVAGLFDAFLGGKWTSTKRSSPDGR